MSGEIDRPEHEGIQLRTGGSTLGRAGATMLGSHEEMGLTVRCPNCQSPIELKDGIGLGDVTCPNCRGAFSLTADSVSSPPKEKPGQMLGHFRLERLLGRGAFGAVWLASDTSLGRSVALKVPRQQQMTQEERERFFREAQAAAQLRHPNIVSVYEVGRDGDTIFIVSEYVRGLTLGDWLVENKPTPKESASICLKLAQAFEHAHSRKVIHRDIKPNNVMLDEEDGRPMVMDFGLAKRESGSVAMTMDGEILGTPAYMSPEQAIGDVSSVGPSSDIFSLGVVLYEMITRERPFRGIVGVLLQQVIMEDPPRPRSVNTHIPRDLETICLKCLEKQPARRYASMSELASDLERFLQGLPIVARPITVTERTWRLSKRYPLVASLLTLVTILLLGLGVGGIAVATREKILRDTAETNANAAKVSEKLAIESAASETIARKKAEESQKAEEKARLSAENEKKLAEKARDEAEHQLFISQIYRAATEIGGGHLSQGVEVLNTMSKERQSFGRDYLMRKALGMTRRLVPPARITTTSFTADNLRLITADDDHAIRLWEMTDGTLSLTLKGHEDTVEYVTTTPDSKKIVSVSRDDTVRLWEATTGELIRSMRCCAGADVLCNPEVTLLACANRASVDCEIGGIADLFPGTVILFDLSTGKATKSLQGPLTFIGTMSFRRDGKQLATGSRDKKIRIWDVQEGKKLLEIGDFPLSIQSVCFSPQGDLIAGCCDNGMIRICDARSGKELVAMEGGIHLTEIAFTPDGRELIGKSADGIKVFNATNGVLVKTLYKFNSVKGSQYIGEYGRDIIAGLSRDGALEIRSTEPVPSKTPLEGHLDPVLGIAFSPDGRHLASVSGSVSKFTQFLLQQGDRKGTLKVWDLISMREVWSLDWKGDMRGIDYTPDGKYLACALMSSSPGAASVILFDAKDGTIVKELKGVEKLATCIEISPNGELVAAGGLGGEVVLWRLSDGQLLARMEGHTQEVQTVAFSHDGRKLVSAGDLTARIWDVETGKEEQVLRGHQWGVSCAVFHPDGKTVATGGLDRVIKTWDVASGQTILSMEPLEEGFSVYCLAYRPDGKTIVCGCGNSDLENAQQITLWDSQTGREVFWLDAHDDNVNCVSFSPDGNRLATGSKDRSIVVWDARPADQDSWSEEAIRRSLLEADWCERDAQTCETKGDWFAAVFYLKRLQELKPKDEGIAKRLQAAQQKLSESSSKSGT